MNYSTVYVYDTIVDQYPGQFKATTADFVQPASPALWLAFPYPCLARESNTSYINSQRHFKKKMYIYTYILLVRLVIAIESKFQVITDAVQVRSSTRLRLTL